MHFCGARPRQIKLLACFSVSLQTLYTLWKGYKVGKLKKPLIPKWGLQTIIKTASWKSSKKDLWEIHLKYVAKQSQSKEQKHLPSWCQVQPTQRSCKICAIWQEKLE